jgi:hypothetical protein
MFIVMSAPESQPSRRKGMNMGSSLWRCPKEREDMPLLRSLADHASPVVIDMALPNGAFRQTVST